MLTDIIIILLLILLNGVFAMTELAVMSSRRGKLLALIEEGSKQAKAGLYLKENPSKFLSTVQIGITLIGVIAGAYSGVTIATPLGEYLANHLPSLSTYADDVAIGIVVTLVTYLSLVVGELVPKQIALRHADTVTMLIARPILLLSSITKPLVLLLDVSNKLVLRFIGIKTDSNNVVSPEEVKAIIDESLESGAIEREENEIMTRVLRLDDTPVMSAMTHRKDLVWFDVSESRESVMEKVRATRHSRYLLSNDSVENIVGIIVLKDLILQISEGDLNLSAIAKKPVYIPESASILDALEKFKQITDAMAVIVDEYGSLEGVVTLKDIMESIVGNLPEPKHREDYDAVQREDGSWLVDGGFTTTNAEEVIGIKLVSEDDDYTTIAGFVINQLGDIPKTGQILKWNGWKFEIVDMDGRRIDKILVSRSA